MPTDVPPSDPQPPSDPSPGRPPARFPRFGWIVGATVAGAVTGTLLSLASIQLGLVQHDSIASLFELTFVGALLGTVLAIGIELAAFRCRFGIDQLIELFIVCALLMFLWGMCSMTQETRRMQQEQSRWDHLMHLHR